ncbi:unnamed protein product, partial [Phaeothamnion confervicola]
MQSPAVNALLDVIVGKGRIGNALWDMGGRTAMLVGRTDPIPAGEGPIYVCTRNDDLEDVIARTPAGRRQDLVFLQNGVLAPLLAKHGLSNNTQGLVYFAVSRLGESPIDGVTDVDPGGLTSATGKWASRWKALLAGELGTASVAPLSCHVVEPDVFTARMFEKHVWICAFMLLGRKHDCNVGTVESAHAAEARTLLSELLGCVVGHCSGVRFAPGAEDRLMAYARSVAHYPTAIKEFKWRNGWFWDLTLRATLPGGPDPCPAHTRLLYAVGAVD